MTERQALEELKQLDCIWINCKDAAKVSGLSENKIRQEAIRRWERGQVFVPYRVDVSDHAVRIHLDDFIAFNDIKK